MNWKLMVSMSAVMLIAFAYYFYGPRGEAQINFPVNASTSKFDSTRVELVKIPENKRAAQAENAILEDQEADQRIFCNRRPECVDDPHIPNSEAELRWMQQYGYPTIDESARLGRLSDLQLETEAGRGVLTAMTELGKRLIERGDQNGLNWYLKAKNQGSIYAYYQRSNAEMNRAFGHGFVESGTFLRVAYILGDLKASQALYRFIEENDLGVIEMDAIDRRANELYQTYAKNRQPTPRPM
jgi:hypothetical protein